MTHEIEQRIQPVTHSPEEARVVALVNTIRAHAASILIGARLGQETINHERIGTPEQRSAVAARLATEIIELAVGLFPNQQVLTPPTNITFRTSL